jgi:hypothetical protein
MSNRKVLNDLGAFREDWDELMHEADYLLQSVCLSKTWWWAACCPLRWRVRGQRTIYNETRQQQQFSEEVAFKATQRRSAPEEGSVWLFLTWMTVDVFSAVRWDNRKRLYKFEIRVRDSPQGLSTLVNKVSGWTRVHAIYVSCVGLLKLVYKY